MSSESYETMNSFRNGLHNTSLQLKTGAGRFRAGRSSGFGFAGRE